MKQVTKQKIEKYEKAFNKGLPVYMFIRTGQDLRCYSWTRITDKKQIKKCVLNNIEMKIDNWLSFYLGRNK